MGTAAGVGARLSSTAGLLYRVFGAIFVHGGLPCLDSILSVRLKLSDAQTPVDCLDTPRHRNLRMIKECR